MSGQLIRNLLFSCRHQFSWPRRDDNGEYYQLCVHCGIKYRYDWNTMRRVSRVGGNEMLTKSEARATKERGKGQVWRPRECRLRHRVAVLYHVVGEETWSEGITENISRSGVLFQSKNPITVGSVLELNFEMPVELTGESATRVLSRGTVVRCEVRAERAKEQHSRRTISVACLIEDYQFLEQLRGEAS